MKSRRVAKASQAIKEVVGTTILLGLRDPRVKNVTVLAAEAAADMRSAKVYVSVLGDAKDEALSLQGLNSAKGFLQAKIADRLQTRFTPVLTFVVDRGIKQSVESSRILNALLSEDEGRSTEDAGQSPQEAGGAVEVVESGPVAGAGAEDDAPARDEKE